MQYEYYFQKEDRSVIKIAFDYMYILAIYISLMYVHIPTYVSQICNLLMVYFVVIIYTPPGNTTACKSSNVTISCGYTSGTPFPVTWIINGTSFDEASLMNSSLYQLNNPTVLTQYSLEVFSINDTTTFQCIVHATHNDMEPINIASTRGTVTVIGMYLYMHSSYCI